MLLFLLALVTYQAAPFNTVPIGDTEAELPLVEIARPIERRAPEAEALGHVGNVTLEVVVRPDGSKGPVTVVSSSRSDLLDAEATRLIAEAGFPAPAEVTRFRVTVGFQGADDALSCASMARQVRWFEQTWPDRPRREMPVFSMSSGLLLLARAPSSPTRESAQTAANLRQRLETEFPDLVEACERQPDRPYYPMLGEWARRPPG